MTMTAPHPTFTDRFLSLRIAESIINNAKRDTKMGLHKKLTHKDLIEIVLRYSPGAWVCGATFYRAFIPTYSQRISEMVAEGKPVLRRTCTNPAHKHDSGIGEYAWRTTTS